jgi:hypothetical protein
MIYTRTSVPVSVNKFCIHNWIYLIYLFLGSLPQEATVADREATSMRDRHQNALAGVADESSADVLSLPEQVIHTYKCAFIYVYLYMYIYICTHMNV